MSEKDRERLWELFIVEYERIINGNYYDENAALKALQKAKKAFKIWQEYQ